MRRLVVALLLLAVVAAVALALAVSVTAFTLLLGHRLSASATSLARGQAQAVLASLQVRGGRLVAPGSTSRPCGEIGKGQRVSSVMPAKAGIQ